MIVGNSECIKCPTTLLSVIDIVVCSDYGELWLQHIQTMAGCSVFAGFFLGHKTIHSRKDPFWDGSSFGGSIFKESWARDFCYVRSEAVSLCFHVTKKCSMEWYQWGGCCWFGIHFEFDTDLWMVWHVRWWRCKTSTQAFFQCRIWGSGQWEPLVLMLFNFDWLVKCRFYYLKIKNLKIL